MNKEAIKKDFGLHESDSGSTEVQVALLTQRILDLNQHMRIHKKDYHSNYGLMKLVGQRRRLLRYLQNQDKQRYQDLISRLGLRK